MTAFDIASLNNFKPPTFYCPKCCGLHQWRNTYITDKSFTCSVCKTKFVPTEYFQDFGEWIHGYSLELEYKDVIGHATRLAEIAKAARTGYNEWEARVVPMRALYNSIAAAKHFIHFTTYGISSSILGALKLVASDPPSPGVYVRGIISNPDQYILDDLDEKYKDDAPRLETMIFRHGQKIMQDIPHQKLIVIDGLLAFEGSANLTVSGLRKVSQGRDRFEAVTDVAKVMELNNRYFSPIWTQRTHLGQTVSMDYTNLEICMYGKQISP